MSEIRLIIQDTSYKIGITKPYEGDGKEDCSICMSNDQFTYKNWIELRCGHCFHRHCIDLWLENHRTCPICVQDVDENQQRIYDPIDIQRAFMNCISYIFLIALLIGTIFYLIYHNNK